MATRQNTPRQNYGNPFSAGSSVAQGAALAAPGFVDYSKFFDTSATPGLQAAQQGLFTQIAIANETHAENMENILPANFDETQLAPGSVDGTYEMLRGLKDQAFNLSRQASNLRGTKEGDMAQMELNKIKSQMSKHYGNNVEYNSMMIDHGKNKDYYSQSFNVIPGKAEEYQKYVKFVDPSAKISYDGKKMMIESEDGDKISFEELKKLEPAMQETESTLAIDQLATTITTEAGNGKKVNDATIDFTVANILNKAYQEGGDRLNVLTSLATDMSKEVGGQKFDFYGYVTSDPDLANKYLNSGGSFNIPEDPSARAEYAKNFESDFKGYLRGTMQTVRDSGIEAYTKDLRAEEQRKFKLQTDLIDYQTKKKIESTKATYSFQGSSRGIEGETEEQLIERMKFINKAVDDGNLSAFQGYDLKDGNAIDVDEIVAKDTGQTFNVVRAYGTDSSVAGTYGLNNAYDKAVTEDKRALKEALFNAIIGDKWTSLSTKAGITFEDDVKTDPEGNNEVELNEETLTKIISDLDEQKNEKGFFVTGEDRVIYTDPNTGEKTTREDYKEYVSMLDDLVEEREKSEAAGTVDSNMIAKVENRAKELKVILNSAKDQRSRDRLLQNHVSKFRSMVIKSSDATKAKVEEIIANYN